MQYSISLANLPKNARNNSFRASLPTGAVAQAGFRNEAKICQITTCTIPQPQYLYHCYTMHVLRNTDFAHRNPNVEQIPIMYNFYHSDRDYIGKMLDEFGLINMPARRNANESGNGRCGVYPDFIGNPVVGRFLSPDIIVQNPNNTQCYNRYSYAINNPLKYSDPSGWSYDNSWTHNHNVPTFNHNFLDRLWGHNWSFNEKQEWNALIEATGGNSLNNAGEPMDLLGLQAGAFKLTIGNMEKKPSVDFLYDAFAIVNIMKTTGLNRLFGNPETKGNEEKSTTQEAKTIYAQNTGPYVIYFKPEGTMTINGVEYKDDGAYPLMPGQSWYYPVDGVKTQLHDDQVFKVPGKYGFYGDVTIDKKGNVDLDFYGLGPILNFIYGWQDHLPAENWTNLWNSKPYKP